MGNCTSLLMYMAPVLTFVKVIKEKSVGQYSCTPYVIALFNCFTYTWYGMPVVSKGFENILVSTVNGAGIIPECFVICTYIVLAPPKARIKVVRMVVAVIVLFIIMAMVSTFALHEHKTRKCLVGIVGIITSIAMYGSPLLIMKLVIRTKSVEFMPFYLSLFSFVTSTLWMTYGVLSKDALLAAPNVIGSPLGMAQLILVDVVAEEDVDHGSILAISTLEDLEYGKNFENPCQMIGKHIQDNAMKWNMLMPRK
ncbi:hypothetical protein SUGI_0747950 [Cryptomeria japonica]|nr:hypothetical protein SUGI_0747950 [Cryptomeria japonica]